MTTDMVTTREETFRPVAPLYRFKTEDEAVRIANDAPTLPSPAGGEVKEGVASYFYSRDIGRIRRFAEALEYGIVGINEGIISAKSRWRDRALRRHEGKRYRPHLADHWGSKYGIEVFFEINTLHGRHRPVRIIG